MTRPLTDLTHRLVAVAGTALVLQFFSEFYFLNEGPAAMASRGLPALGEMAAFAAWYMLFAYVFLIVLDRFEVRSLAGLLLAGSIFGWATEALVVPVAYEAPPLSFIWPSVGWHALIDVIAGWYLLRLAMRRLAWPWVALMFAGLGVTWAVWASWTWGATDETPVVFTTAEFWNVALTSGTGWVIGTILADLGARAPFRASRWEIGAVGLTVLGLFTLTGLSYLPWPAGLVLLVALVLGALAWARRGHSRRDRLAPLAAPPPVWAYFCMPLLPVAAGLSYPFVRASDLSLPAQDIVLVLVVLGGAGFVWALGQTVRDGFST